MISAYLLRNLPRSYGTFGVLVVPELNLSWYSLERPWAENVRFESCIPDGEYLCQWSRSKAFGRGLYEVMNVIDRYGIRFHPFNTVDETEGCIGLGNKVGTLNNKRCLIHSKAALSGFEHYMDHKEFKLSVKWVPNLAI